jgi:hypothetical protein
VAVLLILVGLKLVVPAAGRWQSREDVIAGKAMELARLRALVGESAALSRRVHSLRDARLQLKGRLLEGSTSALAGSSLQSLIRRYGEESRVVIQRLDPVRPASTGPTASVGEGVARADALGPDTGGAADLVPVGLSLSGRGDIYGLVDLLDHLQNGTTLLMVDEMRVNGPVGGTTGDLLTWTVRVTGYFTPGEDRT